MVPFLLGLGTAAEKHQSQSIRTPESRHRNRIRHRGDDGCGKDADRKSGGPHYLLCASLAARPDKGYSLTDCISMATMRKKGLTEVLTNDRHFEQEGFRALFRDS